jgi:hypothetical protein
LRNLQTISVSQKVKATVTPHRSNLEMAFFGLTALGYQNSFAAASITALNIHVFTEEEYKSSWKKILGSNKFTCNAEELQQILRHLFHGPIPAYDAHVFAESFNGCVDELTFDEYMTTIRQLREWAEHESESKNHVSSNCDVTTSSEFQESIRRHKRLPRALQDKQQVPLTSSQEVCLFLFFLPSLLISLCLRLDGKEQSLLHQVMVAKVLRLHNLRQN